MAPVGRTQWRMIQAAGYRVTFRFATKRELQSGKEKSGLRYVSRIDPA